MLAAGTLLAQNDTIGAVIQVENDYAPVVVKATKMFYIRSPLEGGGKTGSGR